MAILKVFAVRDIKTESYGHPWFSVHQQEALRSFQQAVNDETTQLANYPEDFELFQLGEMDTDSGLLSPLERPKFIVSAQSLIKVDHKAALIDKLKKQEEAHAADSL